MWRRTAFHSGIALPFDFYSMCYGVEQKIKWPLSLLPNINSLHYHISGSQLTQILKESFEGYVLSLNYSVALLHHVIALSQICLPWPHRPVRVKIEFSICMQVQLCVFIVCLFLRSRCAFAQTVMVATVSPGSASAGIVVAKLRIYAYVSAPTRWDSFYCIETLRIFYDSMLTLRMFMRTILRSHAQYATVCIKAEGKRGVDEHHTLFLHLALHSTFYPTQIPKVRWLYLCGPTAMIPGSTWVAWHSGLLGLKPPWLRCVSLAPLISTHTKQPNLRQKLATKSNSLNLSVMLM